MNLILHQLQTWIGLDLDLPQAQVNDDSRIEMFIILLN